jgi:hypothetical protein
MAPIPTGSLCTRNCLGHLLDHRYCVERVDTMTQRCKAGFHEGPNPNYCDLCAKCTICHLPLTIEEYQWNLDRWQAYLKAHSDEAPDPIFEHPHCLSESEKASLSVESATIPQLAFDKVNASRLLGMAVDYNDIHSVKVNCGQAEVYTREWINELSVMEGFDSDKIQDSVIKRLRVMETIAATLYQFLRSKKRDIEIQYNEKYNDQHEQARKDRAANAITAPVTKARTEKKEQTKEEKAIDKLVALGLTREDAISTIKDASIKAAARGKESTTIN